MTAIINICGGALMKHPAYGIMTLLRMNRLPERSIL